LGKNNGILHWRKKYNISAINVILTANAMKIFNTQTMREEIAFKNNTLEKLDGRKLMKVKAQ
jgi:hypothetical protein